ncbi:MAG: rane protein [Frankiales bacterium]|nr:rane protein [Frankiales bacterium]
MGAQLGDAVPAPRTERDPFFDNARYLAILLVVMGHTWTAIRSGHPVVFASYTLVYLFHMPAFIVIAGYFARGFDFSAPKVRRLVTGVVVPYVVFEVAYAAYANYMDQRAFDISLADPWFLTWFLLALFLWRITTPIWLSLRFPLLVAVLISLATGLTRGIGGDYIRALTLLPFCVLGLTLSPAFIARLRGPWLRALAVVIFALTVAAVWLVRGHYSHEWLYWRADFGRLHVAPLPGMLARLAMLATGFVLTMAFLCLVPRRRTWFTSLGAGTIYAYLLHGFFIKTAVWIGLYDHVGSRWARLGATGLAIVIATLLMTKPVRWVTRWAIEPKLNWLFRRESPVDPPVDRPAPGHLVER